MTIKNVTILGAGVLGTQIALQAAIHDFPVTIWLRSEGTKERFLPRLKFYAESYLKELENAKKLIGSPMANILAPKGLLPDMTGITEADIDALEEKVRQASASIRLEMDLEKALQNADLVIEATRENLEDKLELYEKIAPMLDENTILCTNSSTLMPSAMAEATGHPENFLALHFANQIWRYYTAEVMGHPGTSQDAFDSVLQFAGDIGMLPVPVLREQPGYVLNSMLVPFLTSAQMLWARDVATPEVIDSTWRTDTGSPYGPFQMMDILGMQVIYEIISSNPASSRPGTDYFVLKNRIKEKINRNELGIVTGKGFYDYS